MLAGGPLLPESSGDIRRAGPSSAAFVVIIVGLMIAGPWLTMVGARLLAKLARRDSTLIAGRRLSDDPGRAFRAISGLVLAVFVGTVFVGVIGTAIGHGNGFGKMTLPTGHGHEWLDQAKRQARSAPADAAVAAAASRGLARAPRAGVCRRRTSNAAW